MKPYSDILSKSGRSVFIIARRLVSIALYEALN